MHNNEQHALLEAVLRRDLASFIAKSFHSLNPGVEYKPNWHIDLIAEYLHAIEHGDIKRLIVNMPPRSLKSLCISVAWPAWLLGHNPASRIVAASYAASLSLKHSVECRALLNAAWYRNLFPDTRIRSGENEKHKFVTTLRGHRFATSVAGSVTGEGGNFLIIDDPLSPLQAAMPKTRNYVNQWFDGTFSTRLDDKEKGAIVLVMQRLHSNDLSGYLLERTGWEHLCLPAVSGTTTSFKRGPIHKIFPTGELLHPLRENQELMEQARRDLGSHAFAAQYLQKPVTQEGEIIKSAWLKRYALLPEKVLRRVQSWDTGIKAGMHNDASACATFAESTDGYYLLDMQVMRCEYPDLKRNFLRLAENWQPDAILIEDKASGQQLLQDMRRETKLPIIGILPRKDKLTRFIGASSLIEAGRLYLPQQAPWLAEFERELYAFPASEHDDQMDALSQFLTWIRDHTRQEPGIRKL